jgi:CBS domain-containing protein
VADVITQDILTMLPQQNFAAVVEMMANHSFCHTVVVDSDERLLGVIADGDVLRALSRTPDWSKKSVSDIMTRDSITTTPDSATSAAVRGCSIIESNACR